tara:strand:+ start:1350 stop:2054 length:705 start_codon:yes stop_codon:yes gene_type:complete
MNAWINLFDSNHTIYANARHKNAHFKLIANDIASYIISKDSIVLDFCSGEAISANRVSDSCSKLFLAEPAPGLRARIDKRFKTNNKIKVFSLEEVYSMPDNSIDLVVMHSVAQYMTKEEINLALNNIRRILRSSGVFVIGDIINPKSTAVKDALDLLIYGLEEGFLLSAIFSLFRTYFSSYRKIRNRNGLASYTDQEIKDKLSSHGFEAFKEPRNIGHNQSRATFISRIIDVPS